MLFDKGEMRDGKRDCTLSRLKGIMKNGSPWSFRAIFFFYFFGGSEKPLP